MSGKSVPQLSALLSAVNTAKLYILEPLVVGDFFVELQDNGA